MLIFLSTYFVFAKFCSRNFFNYFLSDAFVFHFTEIFWQLFVRFVNSLFHRNFLITLNSERQNFLSKYFVSTIFCCCNFLVDLCQISSFFSFPRKFLSTWSVRKYLGENSLTTLISNKIHFHIFCFWQILLYKFPW